MRGNEIASLRLLRRLHPLGDHPTLKRLERMARRELLGYGGADEAEKDRILITHPSARP